MQQACPVEFGCDFHYESDSPHLKTLEKRQVEEWREYEAKMAVFGSS
jgi:hypothetical protein